MKFYILKHKLMLQKHRIYLFLFLTSFFIVVFFYLIMPNLAHQQALEPFKNTIFAHRGIFDNRCYIPENSLLAFQKAVDYGYGIELDVQLTKDQIPVVAHDYSLKRTCSQDIKIASLTFDELSSYKLFSSNERIPSLEEVLTLVNGQVPIMIELKVGLSYQKTCKQVAQILKGYKGSYCIISFSPLALQWFRQHMPNVVRGQLANNFFKDDINANFTIKLTLTNLLLNFLSRPDFISYNYKYTSNLSLNICKHIFKIPIALWTIKDQETFNHTIDHYDMILFDGFLPS